MAYSAVVKVWPHCSGQGHFPEIGYIKILEISPNTSKSKAVAQCLKSVQLLLFYDLVFLVQKLPTPQFIKEMNDL